MTMNARRGRIGRTIGTFALGATVGSLLALFYAPVSGQVARRRIRRQFQVFQSTATRQLQRTRVRLLKQARELRAAAVERVGQTREWVLERLPAANGRHPTNHHRIARAAHSP